MKNKASKIETKGVAEARGDPGRGFSRRTFIRGVSAIGAGTLVAGGDGKQAGAQYGPSSADGLSAEQLLERRHERLMAYGAPTGA